MKILTRLLVILSGALFAFNPVKAAQDEWPKIINGTDGSVIKIYQFQPESLTGNILKTRAAISIIENGKTDPTFGTLWAVATVETDRDNRTMAIQSLKIPNLKFPGQSDPGFINSLKTTLETQMPQAVGDFSLDDILASLDQDQNQAKLSKDLNNTPPKIFYAQRPAILVLIDGEPKLQLNKDWGMDVVSNTPFTIVKNNNGMYYLYGGKHWYSAPAATGPYSYTNGNIPSNLQKVQTAVDEANSSNPGFTDSAAAAQQKVVSDILVSTKPAELIQSNGQPNFTPIDGTNLSFIQNSANDIFLDNGSRQYYVLISGRWYTSPVLDGRWQYVASNALPSDFAKIPEGSPKDNVLASVAGTNAAREAVMDAQIPQTAKVDRSQASANVNYDGQPKFENVPGTDLQYGVNTPQSVIRRGDTYYCVEKGVWFESQNPNGPWVVSTERPDEVDEIPPSSPVYNIKYVYIYDVTPDYVYMGYTPGYLNTYIYGPTVVYGTGYYYNPWYGDYYYPRPWTWGFNMCYNPWAGWSMGWGYSYGWFHFGMNIGRPWGWWGGGWWGPHVYCPPYAWGGYRSYGYYGRYNNSYYRNNVYTRNNYTTNIYNYRNDVVTRDNRTNNLNQRGNGFNRSNGFNRPNGSNMPNLGRPQNTNDGRTGFGNRPNYSNSPNPGRFQNNNANRGFGNRSSSQPNNVFSDRNGNVFQRNSQNNQWQQRQQNAWRPVQPNNNPQVQNLNRQFDMRSRGQMRTQTFQQSRGGFNAAPQRQQQSGGFSRPSGGGSRPSGGGGGFRRQR
ncbi:MAG: hypothetical protein JST58_09405 [Bacteroidetes bacterium]|nr:hypothetical protein [Bacteroidota bacterium]